MRVSVKVSTNRNRADYSKPHEYDVEQRDDSTFEVVAWGRGADAQIELVLKTHKYDQSGSRSADPVLSKREGRVRLSGEELQQVIEEAFAKGILESPILDDIRRHRDDLRASLQQLETVLTSGSRIALPDSTNATPSRT